MNEIIFALVRHGLTTVGGGLVAKGILTTALLDQTVGVVVALIGVVWSVAAKKLGVSSSSDK